MVPTNRNLVPTFLFNFNTHYRPILNRCHITQRGRQTTDRQSDRNRRKCHTVAFRLKMKYAMTVENSRNREQRASPSTVPSQFYGLPGFPHLFNHYFIHYNDAFSSKFGSHIMCLRCRMYWEYDKFGCQLAL